MSERGHLPRICPETGHLLRLSCKMDFEGVVQPLGVSASYGRRYFVASSGPAIHERTKRSGDSSPRSGGHQITACQFINICLKLLRSPFDTNDDVKRRRCEENTATA
ncbi:hypothetical protein BDR07DRAFT_37589 [Suillus spraguei]|nr:hypothetical protein BDR07DRAFT_37589 [Suillus spraguei]